MTDLSEQRGRGAEEQGSSGAKEQRNRGAEELSSAPQHLRSPARLWQALEEVNDPEFPMSLVDMGLVYGIEWEGTTVRVDLTFTAMGCPAMDFILQDVRERLLQEEGVDDVKIEIVWDPPWTKERLSEKGRALLLHWGVTT